MSGSILTARGNPYKETVTEKVDTTDLDFAVRWENYLEYREDSHFPLKRAGDTDGFMFGAANESFDGISTFDKYAPWKDIRVCNLSPEGEVTAYEGEDNFMYTPDTGDVMVEIPKFWYGIEVDEENQSCTFHISNTEKEGMYVSPRHQKFGNRTKDLDKIYVSAYPCDSLGRSISGSESYGGHLKSLYVEEARGSVDGFYQYDIFTLFTIELLRMIETCSFTISNQNSHTIGNNATNLSSGITNKIKYHSGSVVNSSWKYRGMENLMDGGYNSTYPFSVMVKGLYYKNLKGYLTLDPSKNPKDYLDWDFEVDFPHIPVLENNYRDRWICGHYIGMYVKDPSAKYQDWSAFIPKEFESYKYGQHYSPWGFNEIRSLTESYLNFFIGDINCLLGLYGGATYESSYDHTKLNYYNKYSRLIYLPPEK